MSSGTYEEEETISTPVTEEPPQIEKKEQPSSVISDFKDPEEERKRLLKEQREKESGPVPEFASVLKKKSDGEFVDPEKNKQLNKQPSAPQFSFNLRKVSNAPADLKGDAPNVQPNAKGANEGPVINVSLRKTGDPENRKSVVAPSKEPAPIFSNVKLRKAEESGKDSKDTESKELPEIVKPSDLNPSLKEKRRTLVVEKEVKEEKPVFAEVKLKSSRPESMVGGGGSSKAESPADAFGSVRLKKVGERPRIETEETKKEPAPVFANVKLRSVGSDENGNIDEDVDPKHAGKPKRLTAEISAAE